MDNAEVVLLLSVVLLSHLLGVLMHLSQIITNLSLKSLQCAWHLWKIWVSRARETND